MSTMSLSKVASDNGLDIYFREIWKYPILAKDEELSLAIRWRDHRDRNAANKLATSHLRLVVKMAAKYRSYGLSIDDLISEGNIGLMKAVDKFDPDRGFRFSTYAMWWIKAAIFDYLLKSWSLVKIGTGASQKKLFFSLRRVKSRLNLLDGRELNPEQARLISDISNVSPNDVIEMNQRISFRDTSLNAPLSTENNSGEILELLIDETQSQEVSLGDREENELHKKMLANAINSLNCRDRTILITRYLREDRQTLEQLGDYYGISRERVRQLEVKAIKKVKSAIELRLHTDSD